MTLRKFLYVSLIVLTLNSFSAFADDFSTIANSQATVPSKAQLEEGFRVATAALSEVQTLIDQKDYNTARSRARQLKMTIEQTTGISDKTPEVIAMGDIYPAHVHHLDFHTTSFVNSSYDSELADVQVARLDIKTRIAISNVLNSHKDGLFIDLLNLSKRATILYVRASYWQMKVSGKLKKMDLDYFRKLLLESRDVPLYLFGTEYTESFYVLAFDSDYADDTKQYEFNREILSFIDEVSEWKNMDFESLRKANRLVKLQYFRATNSDLMK